MKKELLKKDENFVDYVIKNFDKLKTCMIVLDKPLFEELVKDCKIHNGYMEKYSIPDSENWLGFYEFKFFKEEKHKNALGIAQKEKSSNRRKFTTLKLLKFGRKKKKTGILFNKDYNKQEEKAIPKNNKPPKKEIVREIIISNELTITKPLTPIFRLVSIQDKEDIYKSQHSNTKVFLTKNEKLFQTDYVL